MAAFLCSVTQLVNLPAILINTSLKDPEQGCIQAIILCPLGPECYSVLGFCQILHLKQTLAAMCCRISHF